LGSIAILGQNCKRFMPTIGLRRLLALMLIAVVAASLISCVMSATQDFTIEYIIPNRYRGIVIIEQDENRGATPTIIDGNTYVYRILDGGTLVVRDFSLFERYHYEIAHYADGRAIPTGTGGAKGPGIHDPRTVALYTIGSQVKGKEAVKFYMCVGTLDNYRRYRKQYGFE
jgi:hypothetical protein